MNETISIGGTVDPDTKPIAECTPEEWSRARHEANVAGVERWLDASADRADVLASRGLASNVHGEQIVDMHRADYDCRDRVPPSDRKHRAKRIANRRRRAQKGW